jgi:hypothetical protein
MALVGGAVASFALAAVAVGASFLDQAASAAERKMMSAAVLTQDAGGLLRCTGQELIDTAAVVGSTDLFGNYADVCVDYGQEAMYLAPWAEEGEGSDFTEVDGWTVFPFKGRLSQEQARGAERHSGTSLMVFTSHGGQRRRCVGGGVGKRVRLSVYVRVRA